jgi:LPXTG-site transpeptidase (sortase) family protein
MNMTNGEAHSDESNSLEQRLQRYGNTLDNLAAPVLELSTERDFIRRRFTLPHTQIPVRSRRKFGYATVTTAVGIVSALAISAVSFGGTPTTIVTTNSPQPQIIRNPKVLAAAQTSIVVEVQGIAVSSAIAPRLKSLLDAAKADGFSNISGNGYRSSARQVALRKAHCGTTNFDVYVKPSSQCNPPTARPGSNDHERGVAIDFSHNGQPMNAKEPFARWLKNHAAQYGFTGRADEPWHWAVDPAVPASPAKVGSALGMLRIESAQVNVPLMEGAALEQLKKGAGRERLSAPIGEAGETVLRCQRTTYGAPCFTLNLTKVGDTVTIQSNNIVYEYTVNKVFIIDNIMGKDRLSIPTIEVPQSLQGQAILTLTSFHPVYTAKQSLVVRAELSGIRYNEPSSVDVGNSK